MTPSTTMHPQSPDVIFMRFISTVAALSVGVGISMGGLIVAALAVFELAAPR